MKFMITNPFIGKNGLAWRLFLIYVNYASGVYKENIHWM